MLMLRQLLIPGSVAVPNYCSKLANGVAPFLTQAVPPRHGHEHNEPFGAGNSAWLQRINPIQIGWSPLTSRHQFLKIGRYQHASQCNWLQDHLERRERVRVEELLN